MTSTKPSHPVGRSSGLPLWAREPTPTDWTSFLDRVTAGEDPAVVARELGHTAGEYRSAARRYPTYAAPYRRAMLARRLRHVLAGLTLDDLAHVHAIVDELEERHQA